MVNPIEARPRRSPAEASYQFCGKVLRVGSTRYEITVKNPKQRCRGVATVELDGVSVDASAIPLRDDGRVHTVRAVIGDPVLEGSGV